MAIASSSARCELLSRSPSFCQKPAVRSMKPPSRSSQPGISMPAPGAGSGGLVGQGRLPHAGLLDLEADLDRERDREHDGEVVAASQPPSQDRHAGTRRRAAQARSDLVDGRIVAAGSRPGCRAASSTRPASGWTECRRSLAGPRRRPARVDRSGAALRPPASGACAPRRRPGQRFRRLGREPPSAAGARATGTAVPGRRHGVARNARRASRSPRAAAARRPAPAPAT